MKGAQGRMDFKLVLGIAAIAYGLYTAYVRATAPEKLGKLQAMKEQWGERGGNAVHITGYTVVPIVVGVVLVATALLSR